MEDTSKYLIHAKLTADGVVERSDVVGAVFGQTEGLLGEGLDLRDLQQSSRVGRIDVVVESEGGQSFGDITIASSLDRVETAILAASLETITRVGPCDARVEVRDIEDVRAAKRREVVERAKELLAESFDETVMNSREILREVRESVRVEDITEYEGLPAGPNVADSDAIVVVEGRADVLQLLRYGIKNAIAVEGTNVPDAVAALSEDRTVTAFLDGDRGGELILRELAQVGTVDYVAFAPEDRSVEDLSRAEVLRALRGKTPYEVYAETRAEADPEAARAIATPETDSPPPGDAAHPPEGSSPAPGRPTHPGKRTPGGDDGTDAPATEPSGAGAAGAEPGDATDDAEGDAEGDVAVVQAGGGAVEVEDIEDDEVGDVEIEQDSDDVELDSDGDERESGEVETDSRSVTEPEPEPEPEPVTEPKAATLQDHVIEVVGAGTGTVRLLDDDFTVLAETGAGEAFDALESADVVPSTVVLDGDLSQRVLDVAAQRGVGQVVARGTGEFVKQPVSPRVRTAEGFLD